MASLPAGPARPALSVLSRKTRLVAGHLPDYAAALSVARALGRRARTSRAYNLTLAKVDSLRAWLKAVKAPDSGARVSAWGIGNRVTCCAVLEPMRSSRGGMPKYSRKHLEQC